MLSRIGFHNLRPRSSQMSFITHYYSTSENTVNIAEDSDAYDRDDFDTRHGPGGQGQSQTRRHQSKTNIHRHNEDPFREHIGTSRQSSSDSNSTRHVDSEIMAGLNLQPGSTVNGESRLRSRSDVDRRSKPPTFRYTPQALLSNPSFNKGTAFTEDEREKFNLTGVIPPVIESLEQQVARTQQQLDGFPVPLDKYIYLAALARNNETLFYATLLNDLKGCLPIVYTPTVGEACQKYAHILRGHQGLFIDAKHHKGKIDTILNNWPVDDVDIIVVTDGSRILGLGDLGVNGMGIPIGKLSLYVSAAGLHPARTLPITLDMGTNNQDNINDPLYIGRKEPRVGDEEFHATVDEFMSAVKQRWPDCLVQFEDFSTDHAFELLARHRERQLCFNDDIQGTAAVVLSGFIAATLQNGMDFKDHRCLFFGAGSAGVGVAELIVQYLQQQGLTAEEARQCFWLVDSKGLITSTRGDKLPAHKVGLQRHDVPADEQKTSLLEVVKYVKPTCMFGLSTQPGTFTEEICNLLASYSERPLIFPLSNPTSKAECTAEQAYKWTNGKCIFGAGSPFDPVELNGKTFLPGQANNLYIFPGLGLGSLVIGAKRVTDEMVMAASETLAKLVTKEEAELGMVYPNLDRIREISVSIASAVAETAVKQGLANPLEEGTMEDLMRANMYYPKYHPIQTDIAL
ncbi:hypothetical protein SARC_06328 [Sphaeroforma arctica JP610]|uniref:Malic enzyme n=1 Tax=Sphaeroforma arctica JP610 TaxID=667725 RepID=A0A0L0FWY3_9EUKA|nr:hypothetical protein SARC_06328 [Sphaeroforma arctica JP610]KNC81342.1 hypothetical protein SARC_06328 [Sphaeroforma arctica JP610]|eukprot:XP_014155244.1 hypothetical protein SARC_06328 [Sphaeroforma arctica JP610]